jgi:hypothetical protein
LAWVVGVRRLQEVRSPLLLLLLSLGMLLLLLRRLGVMGIIVHFKG